MRTCDMLQRLCPRLGPGDSLQGSWKRGGGEDFAPLLESISSPNGENLIQLVRPQETKPQCYTFHACASPKSLPQETSEQCAVLDVGSGDGAMVLFGWKIQSQLGGILEASNKLNYAHGFCLCQFVLGGGGGGEAVFVGQRGFVTVRRIDKFGCLKQELSAHICKLSFRRYLKGNQKGQQPRWGTISRKPHLPKQTDLPKCCRGT